MKCIYEYEVEICDAGLDTVKGICIGEGYGEAAKAIEEFYGATLEQINYLRYAEDGNGVYEFNNSEFGLFSFDSITLNK